ncbi:MAG TPA: DUF1553 domain-containing protein, partial [Candidatus Dormibacteraeota bacterium]|nr:DUF1553 domain-containing protein [Candidatus Dormibacteraeota bacterium]
MEQDGVFGAFDCPDGSLVMPRRSLSTTPLQALNLLNSGFILQQAEIFSERLRQEAGPDIPAEIQRGWQLAFGRRPSAPETVASARLVEQHGLPALCRALLNANELLFIP